jgi:hypothetical protein
LRSFFAKLAEQMKVQMGQYRRTFEVSHLTQARVRAVLVANLMLIVSVSNNLFFSKSRDNSSG